MPRGGWRTSEIFDHPPLVVHKRRSVKVRRFTFSEESDEEDAAPKPQAPRSAKKSAPKRGSVPKQSPASAKKATQSSPTPSRRRSIATPELASAKKKSPAKAKASAKRKKAPSKRSASKSPATLKTPKKTAATPTAKKASASASRAARASRRRDSFDFEHPPIVVHPRERKSPARFQDEKEGPQLASRQPRPARSAAKSPSRSPTRIPKPGSARRAATASVGKATRSSARKTTSSAKKNRVENATTKKITASRRSKTDTAAALTENSENAASSDMDEQEDDDVFEFLDVEQLDSVQPQASASPNRWTANQEASAEARTVDLDVPDLPSNPYPECSTLDDFYDTFKERVTLIQQSVLNKVLN